MNRRWSKRFTPRKYATVTVFDGAKVLSPLAYGIVEDVSEVGVRVLTSQILPVAIRVHIGISFYDQPAHVNTDARLVWRRDASRERDKTGLFTYGFDFRHEYGPHLASLKRILCSGDVKQLDVEPEIFEDLSLDEILDRVWLRLMSGESNSPNKPPSQRLGVGSARGSLRRLN